MLNVPSVKRIISCWRWGPGVPKRTGIGTIDGKRPIDENASESEGLGYFGLGLHQLDNACTRTMETFLVRTAF
jgi:hypothetical protein